MKRLFTLLCGSALALTLTATTASADVYKINPKYSQFHVWNVLGPVKANFKDFTGTIQFNPSEIYNTSIEFTARTESFQVQKRRVDNIIDMPGHFFINPDKYPEMTFKSTSAKPMGDHMLVTGNLTLMGITHEVTLPVRVLGWGTHPESGQPFKGAEVDGVVKLSDLGIDKWSQATGFLGNKLNIKLRLIAMADSDTYATQLLTD